MHQHMIWMNLFLCESTNYFSLDSHHRNNDRLDVMRKVRIDKRKNVNGWWGGFAGKFLVQRHFEVVQEKGESLDIELSLEDFRPQEQELIEKFPERFPDSPVGLELADRWGWRRNGHARRLDNDQRCSARKFTRACRQSALYVKRQGNADM